MIIPIVCFTCGRIIANKWNRYVQLLQEGKTESEALDTLGVRVYCCRRMLLTHVNIIDEL